MNALELHKKLRGKFEIRPKMEIKSKKELALLYTPGVAEACKKIAEDKRESFNLTGCGNALAIITDGSAVLGLGNIGAEAAMPVMEGKAILFKQFGNIDAYPICLKTQDKDEIISIIKNLAPTFGAINLEDISAPKCFDIENSLQDLGIPVMHDDQHATAIVVTAGILNAVKLADKKMSDIKTVISGAGAAGTAIAKMLIKFGIKEILLCDTKGIIYREREDLEKNIYKKEMAEITNRENKKGSLEDAFLGADIFIGVSKGGIVKQEWIKTMAEKPIIFALANPVPEIMPNEAKKGGAYIVATGRSDFPNQINNLLAFPGVFRGALNARIKNITDNMKISAVKTLSEFVKNPDTNHIIPDALDMEVHSAVTEAVRQAA